MSSRCRIDERRGRVAALALIAFVLGSPTALAAGAANYPENETSPAFVPDTTLFPGGGAMPPVAAQGKKFDGNPQAIAEGQRLFNWYNCSGCHFHGAGGMGPPLMDKVWIYGGRIDQIYQSIAHGRPNGMPSWEGKIPPQQIWEIAAFVRSLSAPSAAKSPVGEAEPPAPLPAPVAAHAPPATVFPPPAANHPAVGKPPAPVTANPPPGTPEPAPAPVMKTKP